MKVLPNFLIVGAARSGTTSLYHYMSQHPDIFMSPIKEPHFFSFVNDIPHYNGYRCEGYNENIVTDFNTYKKLFSQANNEKAIGESSTSYLYYPKAASNIKQYIPDCKIIILLRNPVDRAYSFYSFAVLHGYEALSFEQGLFKEAERLMMNWIPIYYYMNWSYYYEHVNRFLNTFGTSNVRIYLYDDLKYSPDELITDVWTFLDVNPFFKPNMRIENRGGLPRSRIIHKALWEPFILKSIFKSVVPELIRKRIRDFILSHGYTYNAKPEIKAETRARLLELFKDDILKLQGLIKRDLSMWLRR